MNDMQTQVNKLVSEFVNGVTALAQQVAMQTLQQAFSGGAVTAASVAKQLDDGRRHKRNGAQLGSLQEQLRGYIAANPGKRMEEINKALGTNTKMLQLPIRKLIASGAISTKGERRATTYFAKKK